MQQTEIGRSSDDGRSHPSSQPAPIAGIRTTGAVWQLFGAVAQDIGAIARQGALFGRVVPALIRTTARALVVSALVLATAMLWALYYVPLEGRAGIDGPSLLVEAADGQPLGRVGALGDAVARQDFPDRLVQAVLSIEDRRFYSHWGIDLWGVGRAFHSNWTAGGIVEGGSTITQQLAKMQIVGPERSMQRKVREALTAVWMDFRLGKDEILTRYLNSVYLGAGAYGMSAAARMYFDKGLPDLTLAEAALLAGLIQAPSRYDPVRHLGAAQRRAAFVIDAMAETGAIDAKSARQAKAAPATLKPSARTAQAGSWFADWIAKHELPKLAGATKRAMRIRTTLRPELQQVAEKIVNETLDGVGAARGATQAALVAMRPDGSVVAMVGGRDYTDSQFNRAVDAKRQPGSAFKLFVYYAALRKGYALDATIDASPVEVGRWRPENADGRQYGDITLSEAFSQSVNSAAVRLSMKVGLDEVVAAARELGLEAPLAKVPSMALGTNEVSLIDITRAFASVRAGRPKFEPWGIAAFGAEGSGLRLLGPPKGPEEGLSYQQALTTLLQGVVEHGTGRGATLEGDSAAGKTGTSQDYRDAWFIGFNKALVVGVWVGNDDRTPMRGVTGGSLPVQIWKRFVAAATPLADRLNERAPASISTAIAQTAASPPGGTCDQTACATAYDSFRPSDCTYQPHAGSRRICEKKRATKDASQAVPVVQASAVAFTGRCERDRCSKRYKSFEPSDCSYQPYGDGPRRVCEEGATSE
jgi:penicillin-binding protein 1A